MVISFVFLSSQISNINLSCFQFQSFIYNRLPLVQFRILSNLHSYQFQWILHISDTIWHVASIVRFLADMQMLEGCLMRNLPFPFPIQSNRSGVSMLIHDICMGHEVIDTITQCSYGIDCQIIINSDFLGRFVCVCYWSRNNDLIFWASETGCIWKHSPFAYETFKNFFIEWSVISKSLLNTLCHTVANTHVHSKTYSYKFGNDYGMSQN